ncbi:MAG: 30S ribosomal protein S2 [Candidatus Omnitrophica bacterium]|nr:30S ribosomal protein S2 [Candidatus Omnitrophota bacterium]
MLKEEIGLSEPVTVKQLLEAGVHFGHQTKRWNPKMSPYIFTNRNGVYIIDLEKTLAYLLTACDFLRSVAEQGGTILFVGTKRQAQDAIYEVAQKNEMPYVNHRWLGGMLTNFETVRRSVAKLEEIEKMETEGTYQFFTKKEVAKLKTQHAKLLKVLAGIRNMKRFPNALFVVDPKQEEIAVLEARRLGIPIAAIIDTNCDPDLIDYPIPGNDDAIRSVKLICEVVSKAVSEGREKFALGHPSEKEVEEELVGSPATSVPIVNEEIVEVIEETVVEKLVDREAPKAKPKKARPKKEGGEV